MTGILIAVATPFALYAWARWVYSRPPKHGEVTFSDVWRMGHPRLPEVDAVWPEPQDPRPFRGYR